MSMKLKVCPESGSLRVDAVGEFSLGEAKRTFLEMRHKVRKVLFDGRGLGGRTQDGSEYCQPTSRMRATQNSRA